MLRITWTPNTGAAVTVLYSRSTGCVYRIQSGADPLNLGTVSRGGYSGYVWQRYGQLETRNGGPTVEMAVWALCAQCRKDGVV